MLNTKKKLKDSRDMQKSLRRLMSRFSLLQLLLLLKTFIQIILSRFTFATKFIHIFSSFNILSPFFIRLVTIRIFVSEYIIMNEVNFFLFQDFVKKKTLASIC